MRSDVVSAIVVGVAIGVVAMFIIVRPHRGAVPHIVRSAITYAHGAPRRPSALAEPKAASASEALFERNRAMPADPDLAAEYEQLNDQYFSNILPAPETRWESGLAQLGSEIADGFVVQGLTDGRVILLNPAIERNTDQRRRALCHEMVHMAVWAQDNGHGAIFQERLRQLALRGAFKGIAASDEERDALADTLRRRHAALEVEDRALRADRDTLDRTSEAAVNRYNVRIRRQQAAAADYNRLVEQYNLMVSYPDGLARERLQLRADGTAR